MAIFLWLTWLNPLNLFALYHLLSTDNLHYNRASSFKLFFKWSLKRSNVHRKRHSPGLYGVCACLDCWARCPVKIFSFSSVHVVFKSPCYCQVVGPGLSMFSQCGIPDQRRCVLVKSALGIMGLQTGVLVHLYKKKFNINRMTASSRSSRLAQRRLFNSKQIAGYVREPRAGWKSKWRLIT